MPPIHGLFHEKTIAIVKIKPGIRCIIRARSVLKKPAPVPKTSNAKRLTRIVIRIAIMRGNQSRKRRIAYSSVFIITGF